MNVWILVWILLEFHDLTMLRKLHDLFWVIYDTYEGQIKKATINSKVRAKEQMFLVSLSSKTFLDISIFGLPT